MASLPQEPTPTMPSPSHTNRLSPDELAGISAFLVREGVPVTGQLRSALIAGGRSNLTFRLDDDATTWVLRMPPRVGRVPSAHDVGREYRVTAALGPTHVPVAQAIALCEDESVVGAPFSVAEFVIGRTTQSQTDLASLDDSTLGVVVDRLVEVLVALHGVDHVAVGLQRFGRPDGYAGRQVRRWSGQWEFVGTEDLASLAAEVVHRLAADLPEQYATGIVHGDYRIDNTLLRLDGVPRVAAVVDWELSTIGDPIADVAMMCAYRDSAFDLIVGAPAAWSSPRLPSPDQLATAYEAAGGVRLADWDFHLGLAYFKIGVIAAGISHRVRAGAATGPGFDTSGESVRRYLELALDSLRTTS